MINQTQDTPQPMSSRDYLQQLRTKRQNRGSVTTTKAETKQDSSPEKKAKPKEENKKGKEKDELFPGVPKPRPKRTILSWQAPSRPFKKRDKQYYLTVVLIVFLISLILFFAGQFLPIAVVISVGFLAYVLSSVPPHEITNEINTYGIKMEDELYYWEEMGRFWFEDKHDQEVLLIEIARFPGRLTLLFEPNQKKELRELLSEVLLEGKPEDTFYDKAATWLQDHIPLEVK